MTIVTGMSSNLDELMNPVEPKTLVLATDDDEVVADSVSSRARWRTLSPLVEEDKEEGLVEHTNDDVKTWNMLETPKMMHTRTFGGPPISQGVERCHPLSSLHSVGWVVLEA